MEIQRTIRDGQELTFIVCGQCGKELHLPSPFQVVGEQAGRVWLRAGYLFHMDYEHGTTTGPLLSEWSENVTAPLPILALYR